MNDLREFEDSNSFLKLKKTFINSINNNKNCEETTDCDQKWTIFKDAFLEFTYAKCPICEKQIDNLDDIDHYRPHSKYPFLKCCCHNYVMLCSVCNRIHKNDKFPLANDFTAQCKQDLKKEVPLLINPRTDDIYKYFKLIFRTDDTYRSILELAPRDDIKGLDLERAITTIELYKIGNLNNFELREWRIELFSDHYDDFIDLAILKRDKRTQEYEQLLNTRRMKRKKNRGFFKFIEKDLFSIVG